MDCRRSILNGDKMEFTGWGPRLSKKNASWTTSLLPDWGNGTSCLTVLLLELSQNDGLYPQITLPKVALIEWLVTATRRVTDICFTFCRLPSFPDTVFKRGKDSLSALTMSASAWHGLCVLSEMFKAEWTLRNHFGEDSNLFVVYL